MKTLLTTTALHTTLCGLDAVRRRPYGWNVGDVLGYEDGTWAIVTSVSP